MSSVIAIDSDNNHKDSPVQLTIIHYDNLVNLQRDCQAILEDDDMIPSTSRKGNCHDNAVAESFFNLLKRERIRRRTYKTREDARSDVFDYIEMFYNPKRKHARNGMLSPADFERQQERKLLGV